MSQLNSEISKLPTFCNNPPSYPDPRLPSKSGLCLPGRTSYQVEIIQLLPATGQTPGTAEQTSKIKTELNIRVSSLITDE